MLNRRKDILTHSEAAGGYPMVYQKGDMVKTRDGIWGIVVDFKFESNLVLFEGKKPERGFYIVTVDHGGYTAKYLRYDLSGKRFFNGGFC